MLLTTTLKTTNKNNNTTQHKKYHQLGYSFESNFGVGFETLLRPYNGPKLIKRGLLVIMARDLNLRQNRQLSTKKVI